jgi:hypothetical protein
LIGDGVGDLEMGDRLQVSLTVIIWDLKIFISITYIFQLLIHFMLLEVIRIENRGKVT